MVLGESVGDTSGDGLSMGDVARVSLSPRGSGADIVGGVRGDGAVETSGGEMAGLRCVSGVGRRSVALGG